MQHIGIIDVIGCNDGDYIACGGDNLMICNYRWRGECRFFHRGNLTKFVAQGRVRKRKRGEPDAALEDTGAQRLFDDAVQAAGRVRHLPFAAWLFQDLACAC